MDYTITLTGEEIGSLIYALGMAVDDRLECAKYAEDAEDAEMNEAAAEAYQAIMDKIIDQRNEQDEEK